MKFFRPDLRLNDKWWHRLVKVLWILSIITVTGVLFVVFLSSYNYIGNKYNLKDVGGYEEDVKSVELCHERMEKYLGKKISTKKVSNEEIASYIRGLDDRQKKIMRSLANDGCGFNDAKAYIDVYNENPDHFKNPTAPGVGKFEKNTPILVKILIVAILDIFIVGIYALMTILIYYRVVLYVIYGKKKEKK